MQNFDFYSPTYFHFGIDSENAISNLVHMFGGGKVLIVYGGKTVIDNGLLNKVKLSFEKNYIYFVELGGVVPNPESDLVYKGINIARENKIDMIIAIGGGSVIDTAKAIAMGAVYEKDFWNYFNGIEPIVEKALPIGVVLTTAASGSEASNSVVITNSITREKRGANSDIIRPVFAIMNPKFTMTLPSYQTACGIIDIMAHVFERYFSNTKGVTLTDNLCVAILKTMFYYAPIVMMDPSNYEARSNIMWAGTLAHNNLCGVGREQDWASHKIEHELSSRYNVAHGAGLAVVMPRWMRYVSKKNPTKFYQFAEEIMGISGEDTEDKIKAAIDKLEAFFMSLGLPFNYEQLGLQKEDIDDLVKGVAFPQGKEHLGNYVPLTREDVRNIYEME